MNLTEGLRPWQPQKLYYFYNPTHDIFEGQGPQYSSQDVSPSQHVSYGKLAAEVFAQHLSQGGGKIEEKIENNTLTTSTDAISKLATGPVKLIFGKSLVPSGVTEDVFTGVVEEGIPFQRAPGYTAAKYAGPTLEIGDPWSFYHKFWQAHGLDQLATIVPAELSVHVDGELSIPLVVVNPSDSAIDVSFSVKAPPQWRIKTVAPASVGAHSEYYLRVQAAAPSSKLPGWQEFAVSAGVGR